MSRVKNNVESQSKIIYRVVTKRTNPGCMRSDDRTGLWTLMCADRSTAHMRPELYIVAARLLHFYLIRKTSK